MASFYTKKTELQSDKVDDKVVNQNPGLNDMNLDTTTTVNDPYSLSNSALSSYSTLSGAALTGTLIPSPLISNSAILATQLAQDDGSLITVPNTILTTDNTTSNTTNTSKKSTDNSISTSLSTRNKVLVDSITGAAQEYIPLPGNVVRVVLEFPNYDGENSLVFELDDVVSLSYSVYRAKPAVVVLGQSSVDGFALGVKTVAGSMVRSVFTLDKLTMLQTATYKATQKELQDRITNVDGKMPSGLPDREVLAFMKDDLATFNIHCVAITEQINLVTNEPYVKTDSIMGCMIINNGQVFSVEDLITESNFSFQAKTVKSSTDAGEYNSGAGTNRARKTISEIMG